MVDRAAVYLARRQIAGPGVDRISLRKEVELRNGVGKLQIGFKKRFHRPDVLPVALEDVAMQLPASQQARNHFLPEIRSVAVERLLHGIAVEDIDAHRS